jgi:hypothetical protein
MTPIDAAQHRLGWGGAILPTPSSQNLPGALAQVLAVPCVTTHRGTCYDLGSCVIAAGRGNEHLVLDEGVSDLAPALPPCLAQVYAIHDGMGPAGTARAPFGSPRLLPLAAVAPLTHWMRFGENDILYAPGDWLRFTVDVQGGWCISEEGTVRHWNTHTHELGPVQPPESPWEALAAAWSQA